MASEQSQWSPPTSDPNPFAPPLRVYEYSGDGKSKRLYVPRTQNPFGQDAATNMSRALGLSNASNLQTRLASTYDFTSRNSGGWQSTHSEGVAPPPAEVVTGMCDCDRNECLLHDVPHEV
ncbi:hypothetical protein IAT38_001113 [Cryptococcus sp. DSM 104549]